MTFQWQFAGLAVVLGLPSLAVWRLLRRDGQGEGDSALLALPLALAVAPSLALGLAMLLGVLVGPALLVATAVCASAVLWAAAGRLPSGRRMPRWPGRRALACALALLVVFVGVLSLNVLPPSRYGFSLFQWRSWWACRDVAIYDSIGAGSISWLWWSRLDKRSPMGIYYLKSPTHVGSPFPDRSLDLPNGDAVYIYPAPGTVPENYVTNGYVNIEDQRVGNSAIYGVFLSLLGYPGYQFALAVAVVCTLCATVALSRRLSGPGWPGAAAAALGLVIVLGYCGDHPFLQLFEDTLFASFLSTSLLALAMGRLGRRGWLLAGLACGSLLSVRDVAVFCLLGLSVPLARDRRRGRAALLLGSGALATLLPILLAQSHNFGNPLMSSATAKLQGRWLPYTILGVRVELPLFLNAPFYERLVRTPTEPFPTLVFIPLLFVLMLGTASSALALSGAARMLSRDRARGAVLLIWVVPLMAFLAVQEDWDMYKTALVHLVLPAVLVLVPEGALASVRRRGAVRSLCLMVVLFLAARTAAVMGEVPPDPRFFESYGVQKGIDPIPVHEARAVLTAGSPLPLAPTGLPLSLGHLRERLTSAMDARPLAERPCIVPAFSLEGDTVHVHPPDGAPSGMRFTLAALSGFGPPRAERLGDQGYAISFPRVAGGNECEFLDVVVAGDGAGINVTASRYEPPLGCLPCPEPPRLYPLEAQFYWHGSKDPARSPPYKEMGKVYVWTGRPLAVFEGAPIAWWGDEGGSLVSII